MKRLTKTNDGRVFPADKSIHCSVYCTSCTKTECSFINKCIRRLAAYEDTGLEPEELLNLKSGVIPAHWCDLFRAECDGRLVVLPCKVGDVVWEIDYGCTIGSDDLCYIPSEACGDCEFVSRSVTPRKVKDIADAAWLTRRWGKTVFLSREEAEKALEGVSEK